MTKTVGPMTPYKKAVFERGTKLFKLEEKVMKMLGYHQLIEGGTYKFLGWTKPVQGNIFKWDQKGIRYDDNKR